MPAQFRSAADGVGEGPLATVDRPARVQVGDTLWVIHATSAPFDGVPDPAGWSPAGQLAGEANGRTLYARIWRRSLTSSIGPGTYTFAQNPFAGGVLLAIATYGASTSLPAQVRLLEGAAGGTTIPTPTVPPAAPSHLEVRVALAVTEKFVGAELVGPSGYPLRAQVQFIPGLTAAVATKELNSSSPSGERRFATDGDGVKVAHGITISIPSAGLEPTPEPLPPYQPGLGDALYQYSFSRYLDRSYLGHLDLSGVTFEKRISRRGQINAGPFSGQITISSGEVSNLVNAIVPRDPLDLTRGPGVIACDVLRDGSPWGRYWIVGAQVSKTRRQSPVLELHGLEISAYWGFVELQETLELAGEREDLARQLLEHLASQPHADVGLILQTGSSGSPPVTRVYTDEAQATYGKHLAELTEGVDGFEHALNVIAGPTALEVHWVHGKPLGDPLAKHAFSESPTGGDILDWGFEVTPLKGGNRWRARGETPDQDASTVSAPLLSSVYESLPHLEAGHPRIDRTVDRPGVFEVETLDDYAARWAATSSGAVRIWSFTVQAGESPTLTPNCMGDSVSISMINEYFPRVGTGPGYDARHRVIGLKVTPVSRENGKDELTLTTEEPLEEVE